MSAFQAIRSIIGPQWLKQRLDRKENYLDRANVPYTDVIQVSPLDSWNWIENGDK